MNVDQNLVFHHWHVQRTISIIIKMCLVIKRNLRYKSGKKNIPKNVPVMVWINAPFYLNFKRNEIIEIDIAGFDNLTIFPSAEYMILEHTGYATRTLKYLDYQSKTASLYDRKVAIRTIQHINKIRDLNNSGKLKIIKEDSEVLILGF